MSEDLSGGLEACAFNSEDFTDAMVRGFNAEIMANGLARCLIVNPDAPIPFSG